MFSRSYFQQRVIPYNLNMKKENGAYLEIEINLEDTWEVFEVSSDGQEKYSSIEADVEAIAKVVNSFYG